MAIGELTKKYGIKIKRYACIRNNDVELLVYVCKGEKEYHWFDSIAELIGEEFKSVNVKDIENRLREKINKLCEKYSIDKPIGQWFFYLPKDKKTIRDFTFDLIRTLRQLLYELEEENKKKELDEWLYPKKEFEL